MKKAVSLLALVILIFGGCSMQEKITPQIMIQRLTGLLKQAEFDADNAFADENGYHCFVNTGDSEILLTFKTDENNIVYKSSITSAETEFSPELREVCVQLVKAFSQDEFAENAVETLAGKASEIPQYFETQWFSYCMMLSENGFMFSVHDKKVLSETVPELTLKENDLAAYK